MQSDTLETLFGGAAGGGKSHGQLLDALRFAVCYPGSRQLMLRRTMPELERSLVPAALRLYPQCIAKYKVSEHRWDFANGSALEFGYCDAESDDALRTRLLKSWSILPNGTNAAAYRTAAQQVPGVGSVNAVPRANGAGTVAVYLYGDGEPVTEAVVEAVQAALEAMREINVDVTVAAAEPVPRLVTAYVTPKPGVAFEEAKALCTAAVEAYFASLTVGAPFVTAAVSAAVMGTGAVENCVLPESMADYTTPADKIAVSGGITIFERQRQG